MEELKVNIESLKKVREEFKLINENITSEIRYVDNAYVNNLDEILNTNTSQEYKNKIDTFFKKTSKNINGNNEYLINKLDEIIKLYSNLDEEIRKSVNGQNGDV